MKRPRTNDPVYHVLYWILVAVLLIIIFGRSWGNRTAAFYFIGLLLPIIIGTSYFFNYYLVPKYLFTKKYFHFILYFIYTVIISLFFEMVVLTFTFTFSLQFNFSQINPKASDTLFLTSMMYLVVFVSSFLLMVKQLGESNRQIGQLKENESKLKNAFLLLKSQRKTAKIFYKDISFIESLSDKIKIHLVSNETIESKEKISKIEQALPDTFLRIHRSFIVNTEKIAHFDYNEVELKDVNLTIGRTYKKHVLEKLKSKK